MYYFISSNHQGLAGEKGRVTEKIIASNREVRDKRESTVPRKWSHGQKRPVEREKGGWWRKGIESAEKGRGGVKSKPYVGWISSIVPNSNQLAALGLSIKINIFSMATSYAGLLVIKVAFLHPAASLTWSQCVATNLELHKYHFM